MSTAVTTQSPPKITDREVNYIPLGGKTSVQITVGMVRSYLCTPTKQGNIPNDSDIVKFMMLCKARELDPWVGDAYLTGYDTQDGPSFSLITAAQALLKRAEMNEQYDGMESGVVVKSAEGGIQYRDGDLVLDGETLVGGWARSHRKDQRIPSFDALKLSTFNTGKSRWSKDPAGMIVKCAESSVLRKSFPTQLGGLYTREEMDHLSERRIDARESGAVLPSAVKASSLDALTQQLTAEQVAPQRPLAVAGETNAPSTPRSQRQSDAEATNNDVRDPQPADGAPAEAWAVDWLVMVNEATTNIYLDGVEKIVKDAKSLTDDRKLYLVGEINKRRKALK